MFSDLPDEEEWTPVSSAAIAALDPQDAALYKIVNHPWATGKVRVIPRAFLAREIGIARSTLYDRLARIRKELEPRYCACGCGMVLPAKATRRRAYLDNSHGAAARRRADGDSRADGPQARRVRRRARTSERGRSAPR